MTNADTRAETAASPWRLLYRVGAVAILVAVVVFRRNFGAEVSLFSKHAVPESAIDWFTLLQSNRIIGLFYLELFDIINYALVGLMFLALYGALRRANRSAMAIATSLGLVGIAVYMASNQVFSMLTLSDRYAGATTDAQRAMFLAAGEASLAISNPGAIYQGTGIYVSLFLVLLAGLIISIVMLRSTIFSKATAYMGILANAFGLGYFLALAFAPTILALPPALSAPFRLIWYILIARRLFLLASGASKEKSQEKDRKTHAEPNDHPTAEA